MPAALHCHELRNHGGFPLQCYISHTLPFSLQLESPSWYSGEKPQFPITTRCIPIYFHSTWMANSYTHTLTHTHDNIYCISSKFQYSQRAWLQPHCLCYAVCFCQRSPVVGWLGRSHRGDSLKSVTATSAAAHTSNTHSHARALAPGAGWLVEDHIN